MPQQCTRHVKCQWIFVSNVILSLSLFRTWNQTHGAFTVLWLTMSQVFTRAEIEYLPVYHPNEEEKADAKLYARNVRQARHVYTN